MRLLNLLLGREGRRGGDNRDVVVGAGLCFPLCQLLVSLGEEEKTIGRCGGNVGSLGWVGIVIRRVL